MAARGVFQRPPAGVAREGMMGFFNRPLGAHFAELRTGVILLLAVALLRFAAKPLFGLGYDQATHFLSMFWLVFILLAVYGVAVGRRGGNWKDYLANALILAVVSQVIIAAAIAVDELTGIDTFFTDPAHGGSQNVLTHMLGHLVFPTIGLTVIGLFWGWLWGAAARLIMGKASA